MKKIYKYFTILTLFIGFTGANAQNASTQSADNHFNKFEFVKAIKDYEKLVEKGKADEYVYRQLAEANYNIFDTQEAEKWYYKVLESSPEDADIIFKYSQMLKANGSYERANEFMQKFADLRPQDDRAKEFLQNPNYIPQILERDKTFRMKSLDINTEYSEFGGTIHDKKLYFSSARNTTRRTYGWNEQPFLDIYESMLTEEGNYMPAELVKGDLNTKYHEGTVTINKEGTTMYFSRESYSENSYEKDSLSKRKLSVFYLFEATFDGEKWGYAKPFPLNSKEYSIKDPALSPDGKTLYFASDMPGTLGGFDIFKVSVNGSGTYGEPENLGPEVNSEGDEGFPYISSKDVLYFSSNGHMGLGGLDVFFTKFDNGAYIPLRNAGLPVNSNSDDFAFTIDEESGDGYVSSNRIGGAGSDDIYGLIRLQPMWTVDLIARVTDNETGEPIQGAGVSVYDDQGNLLLTQITDEEGKATFMVEAGKESEVEVVMDGYESKKETVEGTFEKSVTVEMGMDPIDKIVGADAVTLNPIFFEYNKSNVTPEAAFELDKLVQVMKKYPEMVIKATAHTDHIGSSGFNQKLSDSRAKTTVQYVISKGIDESRITGIGMGESEPKIKCVPNCTDDERAQNRRSEFIIVSGGPESK